MLNYIKLILICFSFISICNNSLFAQDSSKNIPILLEVLESVSEANIEADIKKLCSFGTRHTLSDTISETRGIGAARRYIHSRFEDISADCNNCLEVSYHRGLVKEDESKRIPHDTWIVNVLAIKKGNKYPNKYVIMSGDIDSRISDPLNYTDDSPGANDNASGMAGVLEAARVLSKYDFPVSIIFVGLSGEEQGLFGGKFLAKDAKENGWDILAVLNNDMIGNIAGIDGVIDNKSFRIFSEPTAQNQDEQQQIWNRFYGGEVDGPSRQLARYIEKTTRMYLPELEPKMIYRLDRFGRGGHHKPFNDAGFPGVRIMETHENYNRQHQDIREESGIQYGDVIEHVNFEYTAKLTAVNALSIAGIALAPPAPEQLQIGGAVKPDTKLRWKNTEDTDLAGYKVYWRDTTAAQWQYSKWVGKKDNITLKNVIIDNYLFGVSSVSKSGAESIISYPRTLIPRRR